MKTNRALLEELREEQQGELVRLLTDIELFKDIIANDEDQRAQDAELAKVPRMDAKGRPRIDAFGREMLTTAEQLEDKKWKTRRKVAILRAVDSLLALTDEELEKKYSNEELAKKVALSEVLGGESEGAADGAEEGK